MHTDHLEESLPFHRSASLIILGGIQKLMHMSFGLFAQLREPTLSCLLHCRFFIFAFLHQRKTREKSLLLCFLLREQRSMIRSGFHFLLLRYTKTLKVRVSRLSSFRFRARHKRCCGHICRKRRAC